MLFNHSKNKSPWKAGAFIFCTKAEWNEAAVPTGVQCNATKVLPLKSRGFYFLHESGVKRSGSANRSVVQRNEGSAPEKQGLLFSTRKRSETKRQCQPECSATQRRFCPWKAGAFIFYAKAEWNEAAASNRSAVQRNEGSAPEKQGLLFSTRKRSKTKRQCQPECSTTQWKF